MAPGTVSALNIEIGGMKAALSVASKTQPSSLSACRHLTMVAENAVLLEYVMLRMLRLMRSIEVPSSSFATKAAINEGKPEGDLVGVNKEF